MEKEQLVKAQKYIDELKNGKGARNEKYLRNYRYYWGTPFCSMDDFSTQSTVGYLQKDFSPENDTTSTPSFNVIKSCIDTLHSKIAQSKVRPFFNTVQGSFKDIQVVKQAQQFFDLYYDSQNTVKTVSEAFRDSAIFDTGCIYIDESTKQIRRALPHQVYVRPSEANYGKITRVFYEQKDFPVTLIPEHLIKKAGIISRELVRYGIYYDSFNHIKAYSVEGRVFSVEPYKPDVIPFVFMHYSSPVSGLASTSVVDLLWTIQDEIDVLLAKIKDASQLTPSNTVFVPQGSNIKTSEISNRVGTVVEYKPTPNMTTSPVTVATPAFISEQYMNTVDKLVEDAYNMIGISQLSSQSQKPTGLDSGVALSTMENIESDRFETQLNQVIRAYVDIAKICLQVFPQDEDILPESSYRVTVKWGDIVEEANRMSIQFSAADSLSKDPSVKLQQLQQLAQIGVIPQSRIAQFMELPDLQAGYSLSNNAVNAVMTVISDCIEKDSFDVPDYVPFTMLKEEIINTQLSLKSADKDGANLADIDKLTRLYEITEDKEEKWQSETAEEAEMNTPEGTEEMTGSENILTQQANTTEISPTEVDGEHIDLDVSTTEGTERRGSWNA